MLFSQCISVQKQNYANKSGFSLSGQLGHIIVSYKVSGIYSFTDTADAAKIGPIYANVSVG